MPGVVQWLQYDNTQRKSGPRSRRMSDVEQRNLTMRMIANSGLFAIFRVHAVRKT
jgi:hypothetical protein